MALFAKLVAGKPGHIFALPCCVRMDIVPDIFV